MLVLSRRAGESVVIGHDVVVTVLEVRGDVVRVGIAAPREVQVHREEVYRELQKANRSAASPEQAAVDALAASLGLAAGRNGAAVTQATAGPASRPAPRAASQPTPGAGTPKPGPPTNPRPGTPKPGPAPKPGRGTESLGRDAR